MIEGRISKIKSKLNRKKIDAVLVSCVSNVTYLSGYTDFSKEEREAYIFIGKNFAYIIADGRYTEAIKREVHYLTLFERGHKKSTEDLFKKHKKEIKRLGIEEDDLTVTEHNLLKKHFKDIKHFEVSDLRSVKTEEEISKIEKACKLGDLAFEYILKKFKVGVSEKAIAEELENFIKSNGAVLSFPSIVAFGKNSSIPHHQTGDTRLGPETSSGRAGQIVLLDFGVMYENYCSDMTRSLFFGKPSQKQIEIYNAVLEAQQQAINFINKIKKAGKEIKADQVDKVARDYIASQGFPTIPHSVGHGIGLEVHEYPHLSPKSKNILKEGMVFSIEPGIYLPGFGGIRLEDLFVLEKNNLRQLTKSPKKLSSI